MRRAMCLLTLAALLAMIMTPAALAISGQEALFGGGEVPETTEPASQAQDEAPAAAESAGETSSAGQYPTLSLGDRDGDDSTAYIVFMQNRLIELGYLRDAADGVFGENTQTAVKAFQRNNGLADTGIADAATQQKLYSDVDTLAPMSEDSGMFGGEITRVQTMLGQWGFYGGEVDGQTGKNTNAAIRQFKKYMKAFYPSFGVTPTPEPTATPNPEGQFADMPVVLDMPLATPSTEAMSDETITEAVMEFVDGEKDFVVFRQTVQEGDSGDEALRVQTRLHQLKYLYAADGEFGGLSTRALKYFQRKNGLQETGVADAETQQVLFSAKALPGEEYVFPYKLVVDISDQRVYVGQWTGDQYEGPIYTFECATGKKDTPTPLGTYQAGGKAGGEWYYFKDFNCYAKWAYQIVGGILFHSNTVSKPKGKPSNGGLGHRASHGCVRMKVEEVKWIYDNCPEGTTVVIQE
ncbi:MAG: peptidoglycan-binding protein [Clostridia bacterium]|nr:peptidoglycan-binding protein [Clostridia bacterium]